MSADQDRVFYFHADASALGGHIAHPHERVIEAPSSCSLPQAGGAAKATADELRYDQILSVKRAGAQVSGAARTEGGGWSTLVTATVEGLSLLDKVEADRLTACLAVEHPAEGYVPKVSLLGSSIENLRIGGQPVGVSLNLKLFQGSGDVPDTVWTHEPKLVRAAADQSRLVADSATLPDPLRRRYAWVGSDADRARKGYVLCSLVEEVKGGAFRQAAGHILVIPDFGALFLAELIVAPASFSLTMLRAELNGALKGTVGIATAHINGRPMP